MRLELLCPECGPRVVHYESFESMIVLAPNVALMSFKCPTCGLHLSITSEIPRNLRRIVDQVAPDVGAGMAGYDPAIPLCGADVEEVYQHGDRVPVGYASFLAPILDLRMMEALESIAFDNTEDLAHIEYFRRQLDTVDTVDDAIVEIDAGYFPLED